MKTIQIAIKSNKAGLKVKSQVAAGGFNQINHSRVVTIAMKPNKAGLKVKSQVAAGGFNQINHSRTLAR